MELSDMQPIRAGLWALALVAPLAVGCGGAAAPNQQLTTVESTVREAEVAGAEDIPKGELHLKYARDAVAEARLLMEDKKNEEAALVLEKALVDAEMAVALAEEEEARERAEEQLERIEELMNQ